MLGLALFVSAFAAAVDSAGGEPGCVRREAGKWHIVDADLSDCTFGEPPSAWRREPRGGDVCVFVADATGRILGRSAGLLGDRVMWISDGLLFVGASKTTADLVLLFLDGECDGQPYVEVGQPYGVSYSNLAMPARGRTGTLEAFVFDGAPESIVPKSVWSGGACGKPGSPDPASAPGSAERLARPVRSIGPYPTYTPPFSLAER